MNMRLTLFFLVPLLVGGQMASANSPIPPTCLTPSTNEVSFLQDIEDDRFMIFTDKIRNEVSSRLTLRIVDCAMSHSLSVRDDQFVIASRNGRPSARYLAETRTFMRDAIYSDEPYTFRSLRDLLRDNQGDGILNNMPKDHCGCEAFSEQQVGATQ